jgi:hypothetical protein
MEPRLLLIQAQVFKWVGLFWLACGLILGNDPLGVVWRAGVAAFASMIVVGVLLRLGVNHITTFLAERLAAEAAAAETAAAEAVATAAAAAAAAPRPAGRSRPRR